MLSDIIETFRIGEDFFWVYSDRICTGFEVELLDGERESWGDIYEGIEGFLSSLSPSILFRVYKSSKDSFVESFEHSRAKEIELLGKTSNKLIFVFTKRFGFWAAKKNLAKEEACKIRKAFSTASLKALGIKFTPLLKPDLERFELNTNYKTIEAKNYGLDLGDRQIGLIRLEKQSNNELSLGELARLELVIPKPYEIRVSFQKKSKSYSETFLRTKSNQSKNSEDKKEGSKFETAQEILEEVSLKGKDLFNVEFYVILERENESELKSDLNTAAVNLKPMGESLVETVGFWPSYLSSLPAFGQHLGFIEESSASQLYLPLVEFGEGIKAKPSVHALATHRINGSIHYFDLFNASYDNYSTCIFGLSGRGKSVLTNLFTKSLVQDKKIKIIKVDVGGSHSKETKLLGGAEYELRLDRSSGINPFEAFKFKDKHADVCSIISSFLQTLLLEEGERYLSREIKGKIEECVKNYAMNCSGNPSLEEFFKLSPELPRRNLLKRWTQGLYQNAFKKVEEQKDNNLKYYNFSQIFHANDVDFGQGGFAAVMAQFNLDMVLNPNKKIVFIVDEAPFFVEKCFSFFKFSTANVRKFGGSFVTIAQKTSDVVVNGDTGVLDNSNTKFLFSVDGEIESFIKRLKASEYIVEKIQNLTRLKGEFSECVLLDNFGAKTLRIEVTPEEYWSLTSSQEDNAKLYGLMNKVRNLKLEEAIRCLSI